MYKTTLFLLLLPTMSRAEVCNEIRPNWNGLPTTELQQAIHLATTPVYLVLLFCTGAAIWYRMRAGSIILALIWAAHIPMLITRDLNDVIWEGVQEGCIGHVTLSIGLCAAICMLTAYSALRPRRRITTKVK